MPANSKKKKAVNASNGTTKATNAASTESSSRDEVVSRPELPISPDNIIVEQNEEIRRQDEQLVDLEASIMNLRDASLTINQEVTLQNRLLDDVHTAVDRVQDRQVGTQDRLRNVIRRSGTCKLWLLIIMLTIVLVILLVVLK